MPPINADNQVTNHLLLNGFPQESNRGYYNQRATVLRDKILSHTATKAEINEYKAIKAQLETLDDMKQLQQQKNVETKKTVNNAWNQVRSAFSEFSNIFAPKTSDNTVEKEGEGVDE